jgi:acetate---CoA ligase (ADP-forming)
VNKESGHHYLHSLFHPRSVAIIGASSDPAKVGNRICRQLQAEGYEGRIIPVNRRGEAVAGISSVKSLRDHADPVDVVVVTTATEQVADGLRDCVATGAKFAIVHTAGFAEVGPAGKALEQELVNIARRGGVRIVGPNCMQIYNGGARLNLVGTPFPRGRIAMISQSGNLIRAVTEDFLPAGLGFSSFVTVGNQADLKIHEYLDYLKDDDDTSVILLYFEGLSANDGAAFLQVAREAVQRKPVVLLKGGVTKAGARSSVSHTGSLAGEARVLAAAMRQAGVISVERLDELVPIADAFSRLPLPAGDRVAVVGGGGGHATLAADALERAGLCVPPLSDATRAEAAVLLPPRAAAGNPIDFTGASEREIAVYAKVPEIALRNDTDAALLYGLYAGYRTDLEYPGNTYVETSQLIVDLVRRLGKPVVMQTVYARHDHPSLKALRDGGVPVMQSVEHAASALAALYRYAKFRSLPKERREPSHEPRDLPTSLLEKALSRRARNLTEAESFELLAGAGVASVPYRTVDSERGALAAADALGYPVVVKVLNPALVHKSEAGGVVLDVRDPSTLAEAYRRVTGIGGGPDALISAFRPGGRELIIGGCRDPIFGPVLVFGIGGTLVEVLDEVALRVLPITRSEAAQMIDEIRGSRLLGPVRGQPGVDREALITTLLAAGQFFVQSPQVAEFDLNPVLAFSDGALVADARMVITPHVQQRGAA